MSVPSWVKVGAKVVCVNAPKSSSYKEQMPEVGSVYTIREIYREKAIRLKEINNDVCKYLDGNIECSFLIECFRPLVTKTLEQDMEIFAPLLNVKEEDIMEIVR